MDPLSIDLGSWGHPRVGVIGDLILDRYTLGQVERVSPEAPVPVLHVGHTEARLGGGANVAANLQAGGLKAWVLGVHGEDEAGTELMSLLSERGISTEEMVRDASRPTVVKQRIVARNQQVLRVDYEEKGALSPGAEAELVERIRSAPEDIGVWILSDYGKGVVSDRVIEAVLAKGGRILVDPKGTDYSRYRGVSYVTPNRTEAEAATKMSLDGPEQWHEAGKKLVEELGLEAAVITLGGEGIYVFKREGAPFHVQTVARTVYDVTGAGDTVIAWLAAALAAGESLENAVRVANLAAGVVIGRFGTATLSRAEVIRAIEARETKAISGVVPIDQIQSVLRTHRDRGETIVMTNGCFDVLHEGHVDYLRFARSRGDVLVVGMNEDASVRKLKGPQRPVNPLTARAKVLAALEDVDYVVPFGEDTPQRLVQEVSPHVLVKGEDWRDKGVVGREWVESHGGVVVLAPLTAGRSTTSILEKLGGVEE